MTLKEIDEYFRSFLKPEEYLQDPSRNGIQIENSNKNEKQIKKIAFAVDACEETARQAAECGADLLFVHHGLFWGGCDTITGNFYKRISTFIKNDLALYAMHIPLDANNPYGNNWGIANHLGLENIEPFALWRGMSIGVKGIFPQKMTIEQVLRKLLKNGEKPCSVFDFGKKEITSVGIVSGGGEDDIYSAVDENLDLFITGEVGHEKFHFIKESGINVIAAGHYQTETFGVNLVSQKVRKELGIETVFIDFPTGL